MRRIHHTPIRLYLGKRSDLVEHLRSKPQSHHGDSRQKGDLHRPTKNDGRADPISRIHDQECAQDGRDRAAGSEAGERGGWVDQDLRETGRYNPRR